MRAILTIGVPASGKSTYAESLEGKYLRVERDLMRVALFGDVAYHGAEQIVTEYCRTWLELAADNGHDVIVSDTNLNKKFRGELVEFLQGLGYTVSFEVFDTPLSECLSRNAMRVDPVPEAVIHRMHSMMVAQGFAKE